MFTIPHRRPSHPDWRPVFSRVSKTAQEPQLAKRPDDSLLHSNRRHRRGLPHRASSQSRRPTFHYPAGLLTFHVHSPRPASGPPPLSQHNHGPLSRLAETRPHRPTLHRKIPHQASPHIGQVRQALT